MIEPAYVVEHQIRLLLAVAAHFFLLFRSRYAAEPLENLTLCVYSSLSYTHRIKV